MSMTLSRLLYELEEPDHTPNHVNPMNQPVVFDTANRSGLVLLSVYYSKGIIHIDIGEEDGSDDDNHTTT